jgi:hypothetical protein
MSDWLSQVEEKKRREEVKARKRSEASRRKFDREMEYQRRSYVRNKERVDRAFDAIESYAKRAGSMGFRVEVGRLTESLSIKENKAGKVAWIHITPSGNKLELSFICGLFDKGYRVRFISPSRVSDRVAGELVKWVAESGLNHDSLERSKYLAILVLVVGIVTAFVFGGILAIAMLAITAIATYKVGRSYI